MKKRIIKTWFQAVCTSVIVFSGSGYAQNEQTVAVKPFAQVAQNRLFQFPANVINLQVADVAAESPGRIVSFPAQVGDTVTQGQLMVKLDCTRAEINLNRAKAGLKRLQSTKQLTEQQLQRAESLLSSRSISREEVDQRQTQLEADRASLEEQQAVIESAKKSVADCRIPAPFSGTLIDKLSHEGSYASPGSPLFRLLQENQVELELEIPPSAISSLQKATQMHFKVGEQSYPVSIRRILPLVDSISLQQKVRLSFSDTNKPVGGSYGLLSFTSEKNYLPANLVHKRNNEFGVFLLQNQKAMFKVLANTQEGQAVPTDLAADDQVIISNVKNLKPGQAVAQQR